MTAARSRAADRRRPRRFWATACSEIGFAKGLFFGQFLGEQLLPYPDARPRSATRPIWSSDCAILCRARSIPWPSTARPRFPSASIHGLGELGVLGACLPRVVRRAGPVASVVLPAAGSPRRPLRQHGAVRQRPPLDRPAGARAVRHRRAAAAAGCPSWPAASGSARSP